MVYCQQLIGISLGRCQEITVSGDPEVNVGCGRLMNSSSVDGITFQPSSDAVSALDILVETEWKERQAVMASGLLGRGRCATAGHFHLKRTSSVLCTTLPLPGGLLVPDTHHSHDRRPGLDWTFRLKMPT